MNLDLFESDGSMGGFTMGPGHITIKGVRYDYPDHATFEIINGRVFINGIDLTQG